MVTAVFDQSRRYRYVLRRHLGQLGGTGSVLFIMLNPSTADERDDDRTIRRCIDYGQHWGRAELVVCNLFAWRATDPKELPKVLDPIGPENDRHIAREAMVATDVVCAWGSDKMVRERAPDVLSALRCLGVTPKTLRLSKDGNPWHPLYLRATLRPVEFVTATQATRPALMSVSAEAGSDGGCETVACERPELRIVRDE